MGTAETAELAELAELVQLAKGGTKLANTAGLIDQDQGLLHTNRAPTPNAPTTKATGWRCAKGLTSAAAASAATQPDARMGW
jgi:hypothetical protein